MVHANLINFNAQMENVLGWVRYVVIMTVVETIQMNNRIANVSTKDDLLSRMILFILISCIILQIGGTSLKTTKRRSVHRVDGMAIQSLGCLYFPQGY